MGNCSSTQGTLITPVVGDCNKYYVFSGPANEQYFTNPGLRYSIVDMGLQGNGTISCPLGDVVSASKNIHLTPSPLTDTLNEYLTSVMHPNGTDYWVIVKERLSNIYYSFLVTVAGINPVPVQSAAGLSSFGVSGYLKPSKDGKQLIACTGIVMPNGITPPINPGLVELIDFNPLTGMLSNAVQINNGTNEYYYGASFSCNDSLIYVLSGEATTAQIILYQYQRYASTVSATETVIGNPAFYAALQLGPDGKIYIFGYNFMAGGSGSLSVINNPNSLTTPGFLPLSFSLQSGTGSYAGSPNIFHGYEREFCTQSPPISHSTLICSGDSTTIVANIISSCYNYGWSPATGLSNASISNPNASPALGTTYTLTISTINCNNYTDTFRVNLTQQALVTINGPGSICEGDSATLTAIGGTGYTWSNGSTNSSIVVHPTSLTSYTVYGNINGNCTDTSSATIAINALPVIDAGLNDTICIGQNATLYALGGTTYVWNTSTTGYMLTISPNIATTYTVTGSDGTCFNTDSARVVVNDLPATSISSSTTIASGQSITLTSSGGTAYYWTPSAGLSCVTCQNPTASPTITTTYYITVTDQYGCIKIDSVKITVELICSELFIPNVFSPNDDGENDLFFVKGSCLKNSTLSIYDRWGKKVFETTDITIGWNGEYGGEKLNSAVFIYSLTGTNAQGEKINRQGNISLIR